MQFLQNESHACTSYHILLPRDCCLYVLGRIRFHHSSNLHKINILDHALFYMATRVKSYTFGPGKYLHTPQIFHHIACKAQILFGCTWVIGIRCMLTSASCVCFIYTLIYHILNIESFVTTARVARKVQNVLPL